MPRRLSGPRRLAPVAVWPVGIALTSWHYMWRTTPLHRRESSSSGETDSPPAIPAALVDDDIHPPEAGAGQLFHRVYRTRIRGASLSATELMARISADPNRASPTEFARFTKVRGDKGVMAAGDEFVVRMPGPWDGPVRVVSVTPTSFRLATLKGHLEAGQIEFRASGGCELTFTIESWARSGDRLSKLLYQHLRMSKEVQFHMWTSFLERVERLSGGRRVGGIEAVTRRVDDDPESRKRPLDDPRAKRLLDELHGRALNFEDTGPDLGRGPGWKRDEYCQTLPSERPGEPVPGGTWEIAGRLMRDYEFADPEIVRAVYHPDRPLEDRVMLLDARFHGLRFRLGVRVGGVIDETREVDGRPVRVWGWNYRTLQGHLEIGQVDYEVWKWLDSGDVEFRIRVVSRPACPSNPLVRLGLRMFGRREQVRFALHACDRMARLTAAALTPSPDGAGARPASELAAQRS